MNETPIPLRTILSWDAVNWSACLKLWERHLAGDCLECLEIGAGSGGLTLWLASQNHRVLCSDISEPDPAVRQLHALHGVSSRVQYEAIDATRIPYVGRFDVVVFKSVLGGIWARRGEEAVRQAILEMHKALARGGRLLFAENLRGSWLHMFCRRTLRKRNASSWQYPAARQIRSFLGVFSCVEDQLAGFLAAFGPTERQREWLARLDRAIVPLVPPRWRYIMFGAAVK
jgi:SAM-dependent methyltransferase